MDQTVIIFHDEEILAATGKEGKKPVIRAVYREELEGQGDAFARWGEGLKKLQKKIGSYPVKLVLPTQMCPEKCLNLPWAKKKELDAMARRELEQELRDEIFDYAVMQNNKKDGAAIVGVSVEENTLKRFLDICGDAGISVKNVTAPMESIQMLLSGMGQLKGQTAIYLFFYEDSVQSVLMEKGHYQYSGANRLFSERGTVDFGTEVVRTVSGIMQFHATLQKAEAITDVYYAGCPAEDFEVSLPGLDAMGLKAQPFPRLRGISTPGGEDELDWLPCIGALMVGEKGRRRINLLSVYQKSVAKEKKKNWGYAVPVVAVFAVCALIFGAVFAMNLTLQAQIDGLNEEMESLADSLAYQDAVALEQEVLRTELQIRALSQTTQNLASYPEVDSETIARIEGAGRGITLSLSGYDSSSGSISFNAVSEEVIDIPAYIVALQNTGLFHSVNYTGYQYADGLYTLSLSCTLNGRKEDGAG